MFGVPRRAQRPPARSNQLDDRDWPQLSPGSLTPPVLDAVFPKKPVERWLRCIPIYQRRTMYSLQVSNAERHQYCDLVNGHPSSTSEMSRRSSSKPQFSSSYFSFLLPLCPFCSSCSSCSLTCMTVAQQRGPTYAHVDIWQP